MTVSAFPPEAADAGPPSRPRLWAEMLALYAGAPLALAFLLPPDWLWPVLVACFLAALGLLRLTPGFRWAELAQGPWLPRPGAAAVFAGVTAGVAVGLTLWLRPWALFFLPERLPGLWLSIMLLYPLLSALPQEIVFRALFFRRYGGLFRSRSAAIAVNAALFGLAHLFLWNWVAPVLTAVGGAVFAWAYLEGAGRNMLFATLLHAVAGWVVFTTGLGLFFYHGGAP